MNAPPLPQVVRLLRERGLAFTREYLYANFTIDPREIDRLLEQARKVRYQHWWCVHELLREDRK